VLLKRLLPFVFVSVQLVGVSVAVIVTIGINIDNAEHLVSITWQDFTSRLLLMVRAHLIYLHPDCVIFFFGILLVMIICMNYAIIIRFSSSHTRPSCELWERSRKESCAMTKWKKCKQP